MERGVQVLFTQLKLSKNLNQVIVQKAFWTNKQSNGEKPTKFFDDFIAKENTKHRWRQAPFHCVDAYYLYLIDAVKKKLLSHGV